MEKEYPSITLVIQCKKISREHLHLSLCAKSILPLMQRDPPSIEGKRQISHRVHLKEEFIVFLVFQDLESQVLSTSPTPPHILHFSPL